MSESRSLFVLVSLINLSFLWDNRRVVSIALLYRDYPTAGHGERFSTVEHLCKQLTALVECLL